MKMLEQKQLIKSITPVQVLICLFLLFCWFYKMCLQAGKKIFMLFGVTPASSLTGGPWWSNGQYDYQFVELLQKICTRFLEKRLESAKRLQVLNINGNELHVLITQSYHLNLGWSCDGQERIVPLVR